MTDSGKEFAHKLFLAITESVLPNKNSLTQETTQENLIGLLENHFSGGENMSKPVCGSDDCRKAVVKAESLVRRAIAYKERRGYRENLGYDSDHILDEFMETLDLTYAEKCCIRNYFYNLCGKI